MKNIKWGILIFVFLTAGNAFSAGYVGDGTVHFMQNAYGGWIFSTNGSDDNPDQCLNNTVILESSHQQYKEIYSFLLAAYTSGKEVNIYVNGCNTAGYKKLDFIFSAWN